MLRYRLRVLNFSQPESIGRNKPVLVYLDQQFCTKAPNSSGWMQGVTSLIYHSQCYFVEHTVASAQLSAMQIAIGWMAAPRLQQAKRCLQWYAGTESSRRSVLPVMLQMSLVLFILPASFSFIQLLRCSSCTFILLFEYDSFAGIFFNAKLWGVSPCLTLLLRKKKPNVDRVGMWLILEF